jgi:hypothetical protein
MVEWWKNCLKHNHDMKDLNVIHLLIFETLIDSR